MTAPGGERMERACFTFALVAGREREYERRHDELWPEMAEELRGAGVRNYTLFRRGREVFAYCECRPDAATVFERLARSEVNARWSASFEGVIEALTDEHGSLRFAPEIWHLD